MKNVFLKYFLLIFQIHNKEKHSNKNIFKF